MNGLIEYKKGSDVTQVLQQAFSFVEDLKSSVEGSVWQNKDLGLVFVSLRINKEDFNRLSVSGLEITLKKHLGKYIKKYSILEVSIDNICLIRDYFLVDLMIRGVEI